MYGSGGVGKSALTIRMVTGDFLEEYDPTIEDTYRKQFVFNGEPVLLDILDTAGKEEYSSMLDQWLGDGKIFFLCFSVTNRDSWADTELYRRRLLQTKDLDDKDWAMILIANKCDLQEDRKVSEEEILEKAMEWNVPVVETSAKENKNVEHMFMSGIYAYWVNSQMHCVNMDE